MFIYTEDYAKRVKFSHNAMLGDEGKIMKDADIEAFNTLIGDQTNFVVNQRDGSFGLLWSVFTELLFTTTNCHHTNSQIISREKHSDRKNRPFGLWWVDFWGFFGRFIKK